MMRYLPQTDYLNQFPNALYRGEGENKSLVSFRNNDEIRSLK